MAWLILAILSIGGLACIALTISAMWLIGGYGKSMVTHKIKNTRNYRIYALIFALGITASVTACGGTPTPIVVTATPLPATETTIPTNTPIPTATLDPLNPHEGARDFTSIVSNANLTGAPNVTSFHFEGTDIIVNYPQGFNPLCEPFNNVGTEYPCAWVDTPNTVTGSYPFEINSKAGRFGFTFDPVVTLYPSDNYRYLVRCDIRQGTPYFTSTLFGVQARFLSDEFTNGVYAFTRQDTGVDSHVWVFDVSQTLVVTFDCGIDIDWASYPELNFTFSYMDIQIVPPDYGGNDYVTLP